MPLSDFAIEVVKRAISLSGESEYLFPSFPMIKRDGNSDRPVIPTAANTALRKIIDNSGFENITPHDFRETAAEGMMFLGVPEPHVGAVLNHTNTTVTPRHYARLQYEKEKRVALVRWSNHLETLIKQSPLE